MSRLRRSLYRGGSLLGDLEAAAKGLVPLAKRVVRKSVYRHSGRILRSILKGIKL